jgi:hypothetical protein
MVYATVGYNSMGVKGTANNGASDTTTLTGIGYGLGLAVMASKNVFVKAEVQQVNFGSKDTGGGTSLQPNLTIGTIGVGYGGTGLTSLTAGYVPYGNGTSAFNSTSTFLFDGANLGVGISTPDANSRVHAYKASGNSYIFVESPNDATTGFRITNNQRAWIQGVFGSVGNEYWFYDLTGGANRLAIGTNGNITIPNGNLVIGTSGKGIDFSATPGTGTSELLDDYEEGTWTPTLPNGGTIVSVDTAACYTKIGNMVTISCYVNATPTNNASSLFIGGLPFLPSKSYQSGVIGYSGSLATSAWGIVFDRLDTRFYFHILSGGGAVVANSAFSGTTHPLIITGTYLS